MRKRLILSIPLVGLSFATHAENLSNVPISPEIVAPTVNANVTSGDGWTANGRQYRLFGVQACILGQQAVNIRNERMDCGAVSRAALASYFKAGAINCHSVDSRPEFDYLTCTFTMNGHTADLGSTMIISGYAFAAVAPNPKDNRTLTAIAPHYAANEKAAQSARAGLWGYKFMPHPTKALADAYFRTRQ